MTSQLSVPTLSKLHAHVLQMIDGGLEEAKTSIEALRSNLSLSHIESAPEPPVLDEHALSEHINSRELIVELFQTLFEVYCYATPVQMAPLRNHIRPYLQEIIAQGMVSATLKRIEQVANHHQSIQSNTTSTITLTNKKKILTALVQERMSLATLLHSIVSFSVPSLDQIKPLLTMLAQLELGDPLTIPLLMASMASLRISSKNPSGTVFIGTPARLVADHRHQLLQEGPEDRHELDLPQLQHLKPFILELAFLQPAIKNVLLLVLSISEWCLGHPDKTSPQEDASLPSAAKEAFTSDALPWLITHVLVNIDHAFDPLSSGLDILYRSIPRESISITYYPLNDRLQEMTTIELQHLTVNIITRLPKLLNHLKMMADMRLQEVKRQYPHSSSSSSSDPSLSHPYSQQQQQQQHPPHVSTSSLSSSLVRSDIEIFSLFITLLFEGRPHACRIFWSEEPSVTAFARFLQTITVSQHRRYQGSSFHLVASLINEPFASSKAFQLIQNELLGTIPWTSLFAGLDYYVKAFKKLAPQPIHNSVISTSEVDLLVSLLRLLRQVCTYDSQVRRSILSFTDVDPLALVFEFLTCSIPLKLKAALMEALASFVSHVSCHLVEHQHIAQRIWGFMEIIVIVPQLSLATVGHQKSGLRQELETRESVLQHYPLTIAYLHLLHNLTPPHLAYDEETKSQVLGQPQAIGGQLFALVDNLGSPNRPPGVQPYYEYMIQSIFLKAETRDYMNPKELWVQWKWILSTILNCLIDLDMVSLESDFLINQQYASSTSSSSSTFSPSTSSFYRLIADHPAFNMLSDILDGKPLLDGILRVISKAREVFNESALRQEEKATELKSAITIKGNEWPSFHMQSSLGVSKASGNRSSTSSSSSSSSLSSSSLSSTTTTTPMPPGSSSTSKASDVVDPTSYQEYEETVLLAFRILHQVLLMQSKFLYEFLPAVMRHQTLGTSTNASSFFHSNATATTTSTSSKLYASSKRELDHHLASRREAVVDLMFFIQSPNRTVFLDTIGVLSIQILTGLSLAPAFAHARSNVNSLVAILSSSELLEPIKTAYRIRMTTPNGEHEPFVLHKYDEIQVKSVRLAMLQLLVHNLKTKQIPTLAHVLLGLTKDAQLDLQAPSVALSSLFAEIIQLLKEDTSLHFLLEEQAHALFYYLLSHPRTFPLSAIMKSCEFFTFAANNFLNPKRLQFAVPSTLLDTAPFLTVTETPRYMENRVQSTPSKLTGSTPRSSFITSQFPSTSISTPSPLTSFTTASSFSPSSLSSSSSSSFARSVCEQVTHIVSILNSWAWTMKYLAIQIKAGADQPTYLMTLARELYFETDLPKMCILLDFIMAASLEEPQHPNWMTDEVQQYLTQFELQLPSGWPMRIDANGCTIYDLKACQQLLLKVSPFLAHKFTPTTTTTTTTTTATTSSASTHIPGTSSRSATAPEPQLPKLKETSSPILKAILDWFSYQNSQRRLFWAQLTCVRAWLELLGVSLLTHLDMFESTSNLKEVVKNLLIYVCKHSKSAPNEFREHLSKALLLLVSVLNQITSSESVDVLLLTETLRTLLEGIKAGDSSIVVRGNFYTTLLIYLGFTTGLPVTMDLDSSRFRMSLRDSLSFSSSTSSSSSSSPFVSLASSTTKRAPITMDGLTKLESQTLLMLRNQGGEKFLEILCTDATHFSIWQTVALTLLDVLFVWNLRESRHWTFEYLQSKNVLRNFVTLIHSLSPSLVQLCHQSDILASDLSTLYIYESLTLLFTRLALTKSSCEALVSSGLISILADCHFVTYRTGLVSSVSLEHATAVSSLSHPYHGASSIPTDDPYAYFNASSNVTLDMVSETLYRFNQILIPTLDLLIAVTSAMSQATDKHHEYLMKSMNHFVASHAHTLERILRACFNLVQSRIPRDDEELELAILRQTSQIACLIEFLAKSKLPTPPVLSELLLMLFLRFTRAEFSTREKQRQVETWMLRTCSHVIGYSFALLSDGKVLQEQPSWGTSSTTSSTMGSTSFFGKVSTPDASSLPNTGSSLSKSLPRSPFATKYLFDPDLAAAKDTYYSTSNRITLGLLILFMNQIVQRLRASLSLQSTLASTPTPSLNSSMETLNEWTTTFVFSPSYHGSISRVPLESTPAEKKEELLKKQCYLKSKEVDKDIASSLRILEITMCVLFLHLRYYTSLSEEHSVTRTSTTPVRPFTTPDLSSEYLSSQRHSISLNNLKIDATSVLPELEKTFRSLPLPDSASSNLVFLEYLCQASLECINAYKSSAGPAY